jgi:hypothetical protein
MIDMQKTYKRLLADIADNALCGFVTLQCALRTRTSSFRIPLSLLRGFGSLNSAKHLDQRLFSSELIYAKRTFPPPMFDY